MNINYYGKIKTFLFS